MGIYGIGAWMNIKKDPLLGRVVSDIFRYFVFWCNDLFVVKLKRVTNEQLKDKFRNIEEKRTGKRQ